jgi:hypothetical protein
MTRERLLWLVPTLIALHNLEEAVTFPRYLPAVRAFAPDPLRTFLVHVTYSEILLVLTVVTVLPLAATAWATARPTSRPALWLVLTIQMVMLVNALWHVAAAVFLLRGYAPGVVTAVAVNIPFSGYLLRRASAERWLRGMALAGTVPVAVAVHVTPLVAFVVANK